MPGFLLRINRILNIKKIKKLQNLVKNYYKFKKKYK